MELLRIYYQRFFPWRYMFQWLNHSPIPTNDFKHREFSLWLHNDAVLRYQSFTTSDLSACLLPPPLKTILLTPELGSAKMCYA